MQADLFGYSTWLDQAQEWARRAGAGGRHLTIDDVRQACGTPPTGDLRLMGGVFQSWEWERMGFRNSTRRESHGRIIQVWRLREKPNGN